MSRPGSTAALGSMSSMTKPKWRSEGTPLYWRPGCDAFDHLHVYGRRLRPRERSFRTVGAAHGHHAGRVTRIRPGSGRLAPNRPDAISSRPDASRDRERCRHEGVVAVAERKAAGLVPVYVPLRQPLH